jgi:nitrate/nitrite transporter NarK
MYFGMFGSIFLLTQFLQTVQGYSALGAGLRMLAWTGVTMLVAPAAGMMSDRIGGRPLMAAGLALQAVALAWLAMVMEPTVSYMQLVLPFVIAGVGMGLFFAPVANVVLSAVGWQEQGQASGANNALREIGGVFGIAVLAAIFANQGSYFTAETFMDGLTPAVWAGALVVGIGAAVCLLIPGKQPEAEGAAQGEWAGATGGAQGDWSAPGDAPAVTDG